MSDKGAVDVKNDSTQVKGELGDWMKSFFKHENDLKKEDVLKLCQNHLQGEWLNATAEDIDFSVIAAGFVNRIFVCKNNKLMKKDKVTPVKPSDAACIIRLYGGKFIQLDNKLRLNGCESEVLTFYVLGEKSIGPKLYGVFDGGRLEQFLPNYTTLTDEDVQDLTTMGALARKYAQMHSVSVPLNKEPRDYFGYIEKALNENLESYKELLRPMKPDLASESEEDKKTLEAFEIFENFDFNSYIADLKALVPRVQSKVVLTHNDTNRANAMIDRSASKITKDAVRILDFEFCGYNYRGSDIGSHFQNRRIDVAGFLEGKFEFHLSYPDREAREHFIREYLDELRELEVELDGTRDTVEHMLLESEFYGNLQQFLFFAYMVADHHRWKHVQVEIRSFNPVFMLASNIKDFIARKEESVRLLHELSL